MMPFILDSPPAEIDVREERRRVHHEADVVVVGAGILGTALAITFARQGRSVILLEKSWKQPDRIVGELLQPGGCAALKDLGLSDCLEDIDAIKVHGYQIFYYDDNVLIPYPTNITQAAQRAEGRSFHHGKFVQKLRQTAMREPNISVVETTATSLIRLDAAPHQVLGVNCKANSGPDYYFAPLTVVSDGYASTFRKEVHPHAPSSSSKFYGLELHDCPLPSPSHGHVVLGDGAPVLLYQIGTHETRILIDIPADTPSASVAAGGVKAHIRNVVLPTLPTQIQPSLRDALDRSDRKEEGAAIRSMPNSWLPPASTANATPGLLLLGDAMNMRHPLTGGGMTVALSDVVLLGKLLSPAALGPDGFENYAAIGHAMRRFHWSRKNGGTTVINILAQALYSLFAADDAQLKALQVGCFRYFQFGGNCVDGPVGLLAGIIKHPFILFYHFFAVALLAMYVFIIEGPGGVRTADDGKSSSGNRRQTRKMSVAHPLNVVAIPFRFVASAAVFYKACAVIFPYIISELRV